MITYPFQKSTFEWWFSELPVWWDICAGCLEGFFSHPIRVVLLFFFGESSIRSPEAPSVLGVFVGRPSWWDKSMSTCHLMKKSTENWRAGQSTWDFSPKNPKRKGTIWTKILHDVLASRTKSSAPKVHMVSPKIREQNNIVAIWGIFCRKCSIDSTTNINIANATAACVIWFSSRGANPKKWFVKAPSRVAKRCRNLTKTKLTSWASSRYPWNELLCYRT